MLNIPIENTLDVLHLSLALAALLVAIFTSWALYYLILNLRDVHAVTHDVRTRVEKFWEVIELLREKLQVGGAVFSLAARGIQEMAEHLKQWNANAGKKTTRKKKADSE